MNLTQDDKDYIHETFVSRKECSACTAKIKDELANGSTNFAVIQQDLQYIKARLDSKTKFNMNAVSSIVQAVCTVLVAFIAAKLGFQ